MSDLSKRNYDNVLPIGKCSVQYYRKASYALRTLASELIIERTRHSDICYSLCSRENIYKRFVGDRGREAVACGGVENIANIDDIEVFLMHF